MREVPLTVPRPVAPDAGAGASKEVHPEPRALPLSMLRSTEASRAAAPAQRSPGSGVTAQMCPSRNARLTKTRRVQDPTSLRRRDITGRRRILEFYTDYAATFAMPQWLRCAGDQAAERRNKAVCLLIWAVRVLYRVCRI
jgi:hypothetical protein